MMLYWLEGGFTIGGLRVSFSLYRVTYILMFQKMTLIVFLEDIIVKAYLKVAFKSFLHVPSQKIQLPSSIVP